jgi:hypothetical protein
VLKAAILDRLRRDGLEPQEFQVSGLAIRAPYTFEAVRDIMALCHGALILAFARWRDPSRGDAVSMPTVWNHFEGAFAVAMRKEILIITEENVAQDGIIADTGGQMILRAPLNAGPEWLKTGDPVRQINAWVESVKSTHDVFLAYSSKGSDAGNAIHKYLVKAGVAVRDWELDFAPGATILSELLDATRGCLGAIMVLTKDDEHAGDQPLAAPRDNVIFEMGLFMEAKGRDKVLVVREEGAKMPADIGGGIYVSLQNPKDVTPIHSKIDSFVANRLGYGKRAPSSV